MRTERWLPWLLLLGVSGAVEASWIREYDRGLQAVRQQDWATAERHFAAAVREDANPQERRRFQGTVFRPYVPHYYAGLAAYRRGDCQTAVQYWSHEPTVAVLSKLQDERNERERGLSACRTRLAEAPASAPEPPATAPSVAATDPQRGIPVQREVTGPAQNVPAPVPAASRPVATQSNQPAQTSARPPPAGTARPQTATPATAPARAAAPALLRKAVDNWLGGQYAELLRIDVSAVSDTRARAQTHLLRSAAAHTLAEQAGQAEGGGLDTARNEVRAARALQSDLQPDETLFSPRFRRFWQQTR